MANLEKEETHTQGQITVSDIVSLYEVIMNADSSYSAGLDFGRAFLITADKSGVLMNGASSKKMNPHQGVWLISHVELIVIMRYRA